MIIPASLQPRVKVMQIIAASIMMGLAAFIVVANFIAAGNPPPADRTPILTYLGLLFLASTIPVAFILPAVVMQGALRHIARDVPASPDGPPNEAFLARLLAVRQTGLIISLATIEGAAFFCTIAYIVERNPLALGAALGALIIMATRFPTFASVAAWLQQQSDALRALRNSPPDR